MKPLGRSSRELKSAAITYRVLYVDNTQLYFSLSSSAGEAIQILEHCLAVVVDWAQAKRLKLNPDKQEILLLGGCLDQLGGLLFDLSGVSLPLKD